MEARAKGEWIDVILPVTHCIAYGCPNPVGNGPAPCAVHAAEFQAGYAVRQERPHRECDEPGCRERPHAKGRCRRHYNGIYRSNVECRKCTEPAHARGLCQSHYNQQRQSQRGAAIMPPTRY